MERQQSCENAHGEQTERELSRLTHVPVEKETADGPDTDGGEGDEREAPHPGIFVGFARDRFGGNSFE